MRPGWVDLSGVQRWRDAYDAAGIHADSAPPAALIEYTASADCLLTSDLSRAIASAERLAPGMPAMTSPLLRETPLPIPEWLRSRWPLRVWEVGMYMQWYRQRLRGAIAVPEELRRAAEAAAWLDDVSRDSATIVVITHGVFRYVLSHHLGANGWTAQPRIGGYQNWSSWPFTKT